MQYTSKVLPFAVAVAMAASLIAGGFLLQVGNPSANPEAKAQHAVLVVRGYACSDPEKTTISATAHGTVNGKSETLPLKLIPLSGQNTYAITRQWPQQGEWLITLVGSNPNFQWQPADIVHVQGDSVDVASIRQLSHAPTAMEVEAALHTAAVASR
jgi:hypothetical protein